MGRLHLLVLCAVLTALSACDSGSKGEVPPPDPLAPDAVAFFCGMIVADHLGPKAQIHLRSHDQVVWFTSVRDGIAFTRLPEEPDDIAAFYVNDIGRAKSWDHPGDDTWIRAEDAVYVIGSSRRGGMGALETVPFSDRAAAKAFADKYGGRIVALDEIPDGYVLGDDSSGPPGAMEDHGQPKASGQEQKGSAN